MDARFFRLSVFGDYIPGSEWSGETWQYGFTVVANTDSSLPSREVIKAPMPNCSVDPISSQSSSTSFDWSFGFAGAIGTQMTTGVQTVIGDNLKTHFDAHKAYMAPAQRMLGVRITAYEKFDNFITIPPQSYPKVINGSTLGFLKTPATGTATSFRLPPQCATVLSMRTGTRGPSGRGRAYIPCTGAQLSADGCVGATEQTAILNAAKAFDAALVARGVLNVVANQKQFTYSGITQYGIGNHIDTQRRRARGVPETYEFIAAV